MGCGSSRPLSISTEELVLSELESELGFDKNSCMILDFSFRKYSCQGQINQNQWEDIIFALNLTVSNSTTSPYTESFYNAFKHGEAFLFKPLVLAGLLMSSGVPRQKAKLIFELYDEKHEEKLNAEQVERLASDLIDICVVKLPLLTDDPKLISYAGSLEKHKELTQKLIVKSLVKEDFVTMSKFIRKLSAKQHLLSPLGIRSFMNRNSVCNGDNN